MTLQLDVVLELYCHIREQNSYLDYSHQRFRILSPCQEYFQMSRKRCIDLHVDLHFCWRKTVTFLGQQQQRFQRGTSSSASVKKQRSVACVATTSRKNWVTLDLKLERTRKQIAVPQRYCSSYPSQSILYYSQCIKRSLDKGNCAMAFYFSVEVLR